MNLLKRKVVAIDMDLTIVDSLSPWLNWIEQTMGVPFPVRSFVDVVPGKVPYFINEYDQMPAFFRQSQPLLDTYDEEVFCAYWKQPFLYQNLVPVNGCVQAIEKLAEKYDIVFVTHCFPGHIESKKTFLKTYFGHIDYEFIDTKAKHHVAYDVLIDDNPTVLKKCLAYRPRSVHIAYMATFLKATAIKDPEGYAFAGPDYVTIKKAVEPHLQGAYLVMDGWDSIHQSLKGFDL